MGVVPTWWVRLHAPGESELGLELNRVRVGEGFRVRFGVWVRQVCPTIPVPTQKSFAKSSTLTGYLGTTGNSHNSHVIPLEMKTTQ